MKRYFVAILMGCNVFSCAMEQSPLERVRAEQMHQQQSYDQAQKDAEIIRDKIDQHILGINTDGYLRSIAGTYYSKNKNASLTTQQEVVNEVDTIASYFPSSDAPDLTVSCLYHKHFLFAYLIDRLIGHEINNLKTVRGSSLDTILSKERKICALEPINQYVKKRALTMYSWQKQGSADYLPNMVFHGEKDIHFAPLFGHSVYFNLENDELLMSSDSKYLRAQHRGNTIAWDMETAQLVDTTDIEKSSIAWTRVYENDDHCRGQRVIDKNGKYLATPGMALAFGSSSIHAIQNSVRKNYSFPVIMLFVRPTLESQLSQDALINSKENEEELRALQSSQLVNTLEGLPAVNLKSSIAEELKKLHNQARL